ncbi:MAG: hypothetical protein IH914_05380, partial [candidate division Zixibacteria bacterium]|nr:hypothetical protein [candidate division Zixibacteria bacterium]
MEQLLDPNIRMRILIADADEAGAGRLSEILAKLNTTHSHSFDVEYAYSIKKAYGKLSSYKPNVVFIDLLSTGLRDSITFIQHTRLKNPAVVFVLYSDEDDLEKRATEVYCGWGARLKHYFLQPKHIPDNEYESFLVFNLERAQLDLLAYGFQESVSLVRHKHGGTSLTRIQV